MSSEEQGLAVTSVARAGSVARRGLATATMRSDKRTAPALCSCMRTCHPLHLMAIGSLCRSLVSSFVRQFAARVVPRHILAFGSTTDLSAARRAITVVIL